MLSLRSIALATTAAAALVPAAASAKTYCVNDLGCNGSTKLSIADAIAAANVDGEAVRIQLGEGIYTGNFVVPSHAQGLEIVGAGPEKTILEPSVPGYALELHGGSVSQVGFGLPNVGGGGPRGLLLLEGGNADHIRSVFTGNYWATPVRIEGGGGHLSHAYIDAGVLNNAVSVGGDHGPGDATITDSFIRGEGAIVVYNPGHTLVARRNHLVSTDDYIDAVMIVRGSAIVEDSLIDLRGRTESAAIAALATNDQPASVVGRHLTVLGGGNQTTGVSAGTTTIGASATASLSDSVLLGVGLRSRDTVGGTTTVATKRVDTWPAAPDDVVAGALTDEGSFSADPLLDAGYVPGAGSPLIDAAAALGAGESDIDLNGAARALDGDGNCEARPDIGAFEAAAKDCVPAPALSPQNVNPTPPALDTVAPVLSHLRLSTKRLARFSLSEQATVRLTLRRCANRSCSRTRRPVRTRTMTVPAGAHHVRLRRVRPGRSLLRATAADSAGNRGAARKIKAKVA
jgi:hypothetical protein